MQLTISDFICDNQSVLTKYLGEQRIACYGLSNGYSIETINKEEEHGETTEKEFRLTQCNKELCLLGNGELNKMLLTIGLI